MEVIIINKYKIAVYAIAKNESKFVNRWYDSVKEADLIYVLDTGSTDDTVKLLKEKNVNVKKKIIKPWRFDVARNESLKMIDNDVDICVCIDLDEVMQKGWRKLLEDNWTKNTTRCRYTYNWKLDNNNKPVISFYADKIHTRNNYLWKNPVHEVLKYNGNEVINLIENLTINHYPDINKSRSSYLPLLELSIKEDPLNDRNMHYLGREYMYYKKWNKAIDTLERHLNLKSATWKDERSASMRFIARSYIGLKRYEEAKMWYDKAIKETPYLKDPLIEKAILLYSLKEYNNCEKLIKKALKIKINYKTYINEIFTFDHSAYDMLSMIYYYKNDFKKSLYYLKKALKISPFNKRLSYNYDIISKLVR